MKIDELSISSADDLADCLESYVLSSSAQAVGIGELQSFALNLLQAGDAQTSFALGRMRLRSELLGDNYPFEFDSVSVARKQLSERYSYSHLLLMSDTSIVRYEPEERRQNSPENLFEELALAALIRWMGPGSDGLRFGWPSDVGRPPEFPLAIKWLAAKLRVELGHAYRPPVRKDGGVDLIIWRPFPDNRSGFPIVLVQCTLQKDLVSKSRDIDLQNWAGWLALDREPWAVLATPRVVTDSGDKWNQINRRGILFERVRLSINSPQMLELPQYQGSIDLLKRAIRRSRAMLEH